MPTKTSRPGRPALGAAKRRRITLSLKPELVERIEERSKAAGLASSRLVEELLVSAFIAQDFQASLWEKRLGRSKAQVVSLCKALGVKRLSLFGSVLTDRFRPESDVDLLVEFLPGKIKSFLDLGGVQMDFQSFFGRDVDLVEPKGLKNPIRREEILKTAKEIYAA